MNYDYQQIRLDASLIYSTNKEARFSFFSGGGVTLGVSLSSQTNIAYHQYTRVFSVNNDDVRHNEFKDENNINETESFRNKANLGIAAYIPLGVDFTLGKKREIWKRTHLFYELRVGINFTKISELRSYTQAFTQNSLGLKVSF